MNPIVLTDCFISIGADVFSGHGTNVAISYSAEAVDITAMGSNTRKNLGGVKEWSMAFEFNADEEVTGKFFDLVGTVVSVEVRPSSAARDIANPSYVGEALVTEYSPIDGAFGDAHQVSLSVVSASDLERLTAVPV